MSSFQLPRTREFDSASRANATEDSAHEHNHVTYRYCVMSYSKTTHEVSMSGSQQNLDRLTNQIFNTMENADEILVLAESCTAGLIAATLARVPGMSRRLAGSFVVYQIDSKVAWLGVPLDTIQQHGVVSQEIAMSMATRALNITPHATIAMSITGHLGPDAPAELDGVAWLAIMPRSGKPITIRLQLESDSPDDSIRRRHDRQEDGVRQALNRLLHELNHRQCIETD
jgi:nicotinamide-nucleotide amidase